MFSGCFVISVSLFFLVLFACGLINLLLYLDSFYFCASTLGYCIAVTIRLTCIILHVFIHTQSLPGSSLGKESPCNAGDSGSISVSGRSPGEGTGCPLQYSWAPLVVAQTVKNLPARWETWVPSLGWEDPLEEGVATQSSILAWRIPMDRGAWRDTDYGVTPVQIQLKQLSNIYIYCNIYICIYMYIYMHTHTHMHICYIDLYIYTHTHMHICYIDLYIYIHTHTYMHICYIDLYIYIYTHTHTCIYAT